MNESDEKGQLHMIALFKDEVVADVWGYGRVRRSDGQGLSEFGLGVKFVDQEEKKKTYFPVDQESSLIVYFSAK